MRTGSKKWVAFIAWLLTVAFVTAIGVLVHLGHGTVIQADDTWWVFGVTLVIFSTVGAVIVRSGNGNVVGPLLIAAGLGQSIQGWASEYAMYSWLVGPLPLHTFVTYFQSATQIYFFAILGVICVVYPSGRLPSPKWRFAIWALVVGFVTLAAAGLFQPVEVERLPDVTLAPPLVAGWELPFGGSLFLLLWIPVLMGVVRLVLHYFRARGVDRLQMKWLAFAFMSGFGLLAVAFLLPAPADGVIRALGGFVLIAGSPVAIGVAILKYRLYEINRIISRTVGYVMVVGVLGVVYAVGAVWLPSRLTGDSPLFVAASTLAVAALFNPLRRRVLRWVDRRFYRSRYDAERVVEEFSGRLRRLTDVDRLTTDWVGVVTATMQPSAIGVWVRNS